MTQLYADSFTGSGNVTGRTPDVGAAWETFAGCATLVITANTAVPSSGAQLYGNRAGTAAATADYSIAADIPNPGSGSSIGIALRDQGSSTYYLAVLQADASPNTININRVVGGAFSTIATVNYPWSGVHRLYFEAVGSDASVVLKVKVDGTEVLSTTDTSGSRITGIGRAALFTWNGNGFSYVGGFDNVSVDDVSNAATAVTITGPTSGNVSVASTNFTVGANGPITGTVVVTPSSGGGGGTFTPSTVSISSGSPTATFTYTPATVGAKTISVTNNGSLYNPSNITYTSNAVPVTVNVSDSNWSWSPYNWDDTGSGKRSNCTGAYCALGFSGTSITFNFNTSSLSGAGMAAGEYPRLGYVVDNGPVTYATLTSALAITGLASGTHEIKLWFDGAFYYPTAYDRWTNPSNVVHITSATIDAGATTSATTVAPGRGIWFGDSISEGQYTNSAGDLPAANSSYRAAPALIAKALNAEIGVVPFSFQGFAQAGYGNVPALPSAYGLYSAGRSRLSAGLFSPAPDYVFCCHGTNGSNVQATIQTQIGNFRTAAPNAFIVMIVPPGGNGRSVIAAAVSAYIAANPTERKVIVLDLGLSEDSGLTGLGSATLKSFDGLHPHADWHAHLAVMWTKQLSNKIFVTSGTKTATVSLVDASNAPRVSLTGLKWAFWDQATPDLMNTPSDFGSGATTNSSGVLSLTVKTSLSSGGVGWLIVTDSDGNPATVHKAFSGPVTVA